MARKTVTELSIKETIASGDVAAVRFENRTAKGVVESCDWVRIGGDRIKEIRSFYELAQPFSISAPAISKHMKILEGAGLINRRVEGRRHHCTLNPQALGEAQDWLSYYRDFWEARLDELESFLEESEKSSKQRPETTQQKGSKRMKGTTP